MTSENEFRLLEPEGQTPEEVIGDKRGFKLPLPDQDRVELESRLQRRQFRRISLAEMMIVTTAVCLIFAASTWIPLEIFSAILGVTVVIAATVAKLIKFNSRTTFLVLSTLFVGYLVSVVAALAKVHQG